MKKFKLKTPEEVAIMAEAGKKLSVVKKALREAVAEGVAANRIEELANSLIRDQSAVPSFKMVPGYKWATCINVNDGVVHGIPKADMVFKKNDIVSVDVGLYFNGFHSDTSFSKLLGSDPDKQRFLELGQRALNAAIKKAKTGRRLGDISEAIESTLLAGGAVPIESLVGHGIGRDLHEDPMIPGYTGYKGEDFKLKEGVVLAIEVMYTTGSGEVETAPDGWTIRTRDGKISALFEETVAVGIDGPFVLTA